MPEDNATLAVYSSPTDAELAIARLQAAGFDMQKVSVVAGERQGEDHVFGCYGDHHGCRYWGELGNFWGALWGLLSGWAFFSIPGIGPVLVAGPLSGWMVATLEHAAIFAGLGLSALGAGLYSIGMRRERIQECEAALKAGKYLVLAHGASGEVAKAREILKLAGAKVLTA